MQRAKEGRKGRNAENEKKKENGEMERAKERMKSEKRNEREKEKCGERKGEGDDRVRGDIRRIVLPDYPLTVFAIFARRQLNVLSWRGKTVQSVLEEL